MANPLVFIQCGLLRWKRSMFCFKRPRNIELNIPDISVFPGFPQCQFPSFRFFVDGKTSNTVETDRTAKWPERFLKSFLQKLTLGQQWSYAVFGKSYSFTDNPGFRFLYRNRRYIFKYEWLLNKPKILRWALATSAGNYLGTLARIYINTCRHYMV